MIKTLTRTLAQTHLACVSVCARFFGLTDTKRAAMVETFQRITANPMPQSTHAQSFSERKNAERYVQKPHQPNENNYDFNNKDYNNNDGDSGGGDDGAATLTATATKPQHKLKVCNMSDEVLPLRYDSFRMHQHPYECS